MFPRAFFGPGQARKALTLQNVPFIRAQMAAGAIPPPLFFERRRHGSTFASREWHSLTEHPEQHDSVDHAVERRAHSGPTTRERLPPKDI
jgi:hypothetical protein